MITQREANLIERLLDFVEVFEDMLATTDMNDIHDLLFNNAEKLIDRARETIRETKEIE